MWLSSSFYSLIIQQQKVVNTISPIFFIFTKCCDLSSPLVFFSSVFVPDSYDKMTLCLSNDRDVLTVADSKR